jgi:lysophospholipase L1-like esterase
MKKIVLLGDSIRIGYQAIVRAELEGVADVWVPPDNGQHTTNLLLRFNDWVILQRPDVLHLNAGLWDVRHVARGRHDLGNVVPVEQYRANVRRLLTLAKQYASGAVIWATTTPIDEAANFQQTAPADHPARRGADVAEYNAAAVEEATTLGVGVNDLHKIVLEYGPARWLSPDGMHATEDGYAAVGRRVADVLRKLV